jgi:hypothetical protein
MTIKSDFKIAIFDRKKTGSGHQPQEHAKNPKAAAFFSAFFAFFVASSVVLFCAVSLGFPQKNWLKPALTGLNSHKMKFLILQPTIRNMNLAGNRGASACGSRSAELISRSSFKSSRGGIVRIRPAQAAPSDLIRLFGQVIQDLYFTWLPCS